MRRSDREVREDGQIVEIMNRCPVLHLGLRGEKAPYLLPVTFGMEPDGMTLYIHGAMTGTKYDLLARDNRAGFNMTLAGALVLDTENHSCSMNYESVSGWGILEEVTDEAGKHHALQMIMAHYHAGDMPFDTKPLPRTRILRLRVRERTAKRRKQE